MISSFVSGLRSRVRGQIRRKTSKLEPHVRDGLAAEVRDGIYGHDSTEEGTSQTAAVKELEDELDTAKEELQQLEEKQQFIETRLFKYKRILKDASQGNPNHDEEDQAGESQRRQQLSKVLETVEVNHRSILVQIERMRRRIRRMEKQRDDLIWQLQECQDFLDAAENDNDDPTLVVQETIVEEHEDEEHEDQAEDGAHDDHNDDTKEDVVIDEKETPSEEIELNELKIRENDGDNQDGVSHVDRVEEAAGSALEKEKVIVEKG